MRQGGTRAELYQRIGANRDASLILAYPTAAWARRVYPELPADEAQRALAVDVLHFARIGAEDGPGDAALGRHLATLEERAAVANGLAPIPGGRLVDRAAFGANRSGDALTATAAPAKVVMHNPAPRKPK